MFGYFHKELMKFEAIKEANDESAVVDADQKKGKNFKDLFQVPDEEELKTVTKPTVIKFPKFTKPIFSVTCGADHALALTIDKEMYSWGSNNYGALGFGKGYEETVSEPTKLEILDHTG
jgi:alpha-tubulin suppressor-like RCC1 family protein